jgi:predicted DNA-binding transcriptional regulator YafY
VIRPDEYEMPDPGLTDEERAALWLAQQVVRLGGQPQGPEAILKLGGAPMAGGGEPLAAELGLAAEELGSLFQAVTERRTVRFEYRSRLREARPYGLVHQRGHWYLVGEVTEGIRAFRVDRAEGIEFTSGEGAFTRPAGFRVSEFLPSVPWEAGSGAREAEVQFDAEVAWWADRQLPESAVRSIQEDGSMVVKLIVANVDALIGWLFAFDQHAEIVGPADLRGRVIDRVRGLV